MRYIIGAILIIGGLYITGFFDEALAQYGLNWGPCIEYASGWQCQ